MQKLGLLTLTLIMGLVATSIATADIKAIQQKNSAMKVATIAKMYEQDVSNEGMDDPVVLQQYGNPDLQAAMQLEQDYFDREEISCHIGYDVLWNSQDPDYEQDKQFSLTEEGLVKVSLAQGGDVYYELSCDDIDDSANCQVADVILDEDGSSLKDYLIEACR